jgi:hypothetical protein
LTSNQDVKDQIHDHLTNRKSIAIRSWTDAEDMLLRSAVKEYGEHAWTNLSRNVFCLSRNSQQCRQRWSKVLRPGIKKGSWTHEEDSNLRRAVCQTLEKDIRKIQWNCVAQHVPARTHAMCRERWKNHLDPNINHSEFSTEEKAKLQQLHILFGNKYSSIARLMPGRTSEKVKAWYRARGFLRGKKTEQGMTLAAKSAVLLHQQMEIAQQSQQPPPPPQQLLQRDHLLPGISRELLAMAAIPALEPDVETGYRPPASAFVC